VPPVTCEGVQRGSSTLDYVRGDTNMLSAALTPAVPTLRGKKEIIEDGLFRCGLRVDGQSRDPYPRPEVSTKIL
jgi:hypothetical protein